MSMYKLYELSDAMNRVADMIEEGAEGLEDTLESIEGTFQDKVESICKLIRSKEAEGEMIKSEMARLKQRADKLDRDAAWLYNYVEREMKRANVTSVKSTLFGIKLQMSPPRVEVDGIEDLPPRYMRVSTTKMPDKMGIKEALLRGEIVPGCRLAQDMKLKVK